MVKVLIASVGGAWQPIVNVCKSDDFAYIFFLCSENGRSSSSKVVDGTGKPCKRKNELICPNCRRKNAVICGNCKQPIPLVQRERSIVAQLGLESNKYDKITVKDPDDLTQLITALKNVEPKVQKLFPDRRIELIANYTGGTKTMSTALGLMAVLRNWSLIFNKGPRQDLTRVTYGDRPIPIDKSLIEREFCLEWIRPLLNRYDYRAAEELLSAYHDDALLPLWRVCKALTFWDVFNHQEAYKWLSGECRESLKLLVNRAAQLSQPEDIKLEKAPYDAVIDLILNAERRACQERYDDAVARLYRALELLAQTRLKKKYDICSNNVKPMDLPSAIQKKYEHMQTNDSKLQLALFNVYELLDDLNDDLGALFKAQENQIRNLLRNRNDSILAHGNSVVNAEKYREMNTVIKQFVKKFLKQIKYKSAWVQLPQSDILESMLK